jgi:hypothetical protein
MATVTGTFELGDDGKLTLLESTSFTLTGEDGTVTEVDASLAEGSYFTFEGGTATGTVIPVDS